MNKKILGAVIVIAVILVGGFYFLSNGSGSVADTSVASEPVEITHELGTITIDGTPKRVVVLDYGALDCLDALGIEGIVGVPQSSSIPEYLSKYTSEDYANAGSIKEPDLEAIYAMEPDLIIMAGRMTDYYDQLSEIATTLYVSVDANDYLGSFKSLMAQYGQIFDKADSVDTLIADVDTKAEEVKAKAEILNATSSILMLNGRTISTYGAGSRYGILYSDLGFIQADESIEVSTHGQEVSFEYVAELNPGYLFVINRNEITGSEEASAQSIIENELVMGTDAYKNGNIVYLDAVTWYTVSGGYQATLNMIQEVSDAVK